MSKLNKFMASAFGIGSTKIDTIIETTYPKPGEEIRGTFKIHGGKIEQYINQIELDVCTSYIKEVDDKKVERVEVLQREVFEIDRNIGPEEISELDFVFYLGQVVPLTQGKTKVWVSTNLDIAKGVDSSDRDYLKVYPNEFMENTLQAVKELGFRLREIENEYCSRSFNGLNCLQEFEFVPYTGQFAGRLDELEIVFRPDGEDMDLIIQVDRRARGLFSFISEAMETDETHLKLSLSNYNSWNKDEIKNEIEEVIGRYS